jgi:hypothetical protein
MLMTITQNAGNGIDGLLDSVFSFLQRRTDFYYEAEPGDKMGFPPQYAEGLVSYKKLVNTFKIYRHFKTYQIEHEKKFPSKGKDLEKRWDTYKANAEKAKEL